MCVKEAERRMDVIDCLAGWVVHCHFRLQEDWKKYRLALEDGVYADFWRGVLRSDIADLRKARKVLKEF